MKLSREVCTVYPRIYITSKTRKIIEDESIVFSPKGHEYNVSKVVLKRLGGDGSMPTTKTFNGYISCQPFEEIEVKINDKLVFKDVEYIITSIEESTYNCFYIEAKS